MRKEAEALKAWMLAEIDKRVADLSQYNDGSGSHQDLEAASRIDAYRHAKEIIRLADPDHTLAEVRRRDERARAKKYAERQAKTKAAFADGIKRGLTQKLSEEWGLSKQRVAQLRRGAFRRAA